MGKSRRLSRPTKNILIGFDTEPVTLPLDKIVPLKIVTADMKKDRHYRQIVASIRLGGIIEPPIVARQGKGRYVLLEGHLRLEALKELGKEEMTCLVSKDDEAFTHNKFVNHISPVQEHKMILNAIKHGVSEQTLAEALAMDVTGIIKRKRLLEGICPEAATLLEDKMIAAEVFSILKRMVAMRQIEVAMLMNDACLYTSTYAKMLYTATPSEQLTDPKKPKKVRGLTPEQISRVEKESAMLHREYLLIKENYGIDHVNLTIIRSYLSNLLGNARVVRYLAQDYPDFLKYFQKIIDMTSLNDAEKAA